MKYDYTYWDSVADTTPRNSNFDEIIADHYRRAHLNLIGRWVSINKTLSILKTDLFAEAVCPSRSFLWPILKENNYITGIDISEEMCEKARQNATSFFPEQRCTFVSCDVRNLVFASDTFDLIISDSTLDHFKQKSDISLALNELVRVLKPGGTLIITLDNKQNISEPLFRLWICLHLSPFYIGKTYSIKELKTALSKADMQIKDSTGLIHNPRFFAKLIVAMIRRLSPNNYMRLSRKLLDFFDSLENKNTKYLTSQFIAVKAVKNKAIPSPQTP